MRVYISGPITGVEDYKDKFLKAAEFLSKKGYDVINPTVIDGIFPDLEYEEYMKLDIALLDLSDAIYMMNGWEKSCGASREYGYALEAGKQIMMEELHE